jgi:hypothetical protein
MIKNVARRLKKDNHDFKVQFEGYKILFIVER